MAQVVRFERDSIRRFLRHLEFSRRGTMSRFRPTVERCESRLLPTLVFVFGGNAFAATKPDHLTQIAASMLEQNGDKAVQVPTPPIGSPHAFFSLAARLARFAKGQPIGLVGFSAGGSLAARLSAVPQLHVKAALDFYGPPDLTDWFTYHQSDRFAQYVTTHVGLTRDFIALMSGASPSRAFVVCAFGTRDQNVVASVSTASFQREFAHGKVFTYPGPHGVSVRSCPPAFNEFVRHLAAGSTTGSTPSATIARSPLRVIA
jgi:dienelactone hydrolase